MLGRRNVRVLEEDGEGELVSWCPRKKRALGDWAGDENKGENRHWRDVQWGREWSRRRSRSI